MSSPRHSCFLSSASHNSGLINEHDWILVHISFTQSIPVCVSRTSPPLQTKHGCLRVSELIDKYRYGDRVHLKKGWVILLKLTPQLWTRCLPHRTQIVYDTDIALAALKLELRPGKRVLECGVGSGSVTHAFARQSIPIRSSVAPSGHVFAFDFHADRVKLAKDELQSHGLSPEVVSVTQTDAYAEDAFQVAKDVDAVFLDVPKPWLALNNAKKVMAKDGMARLASFSPCIEQTQRMTLALAQAGFDDVESVECLRREFQVRRITLDDPLAQARALKRGRKRRLEDSDDKSEKEEISEDGQQDYKEIKSGEQVESEVVEDDKNEISSSLDNGKSSFLTGLPLTTMAGHTGYLTFATLPLHTCLKKEVTS